jgi:L,D-transpeptidase catalytic domain
MTVAGGLGIGPGAAFASAHHTGPSSTSSASSESDAGSESSSRAESSAGGSWLTVDHSSDDSQTRSNDTAPPTPGGGGGGGGGGGEPTAPAIPASSGHGKRIVFDQSDQRVWLVGRKGHLARTYLVSGSIHDNLSPGSYEVYSKSPHAVSFDGRETMRHMVRFTQGQHAAIGFHDIPRRPNGSLVETRDQLGTPLSAGCIRQWEPDAKALWRFAPVGTKVVVVA